MKTKLCSFIAFWVFAIWTAPVAGAVTDQIGGDWVGGSNLFGNPVFISIRFSDSPAGPPGIVNIQLWRVSNRPLSKLQVEGSRVLFEFPSTTGIPFKGEGELKDGVIEGTMRRAEQQGKFHLVRLANVDRKLLDKYVGAFRFADPDAPGKSRSSLITYNARGHLRWLDLNTGDTTGLFPMSENKFFFAFSVINSPSPQNMTWEFETSPQGEVTRSILLVSTSLRRLSKATATRTSEASSSKDCLCQSPLESPVPCLS